MTADTSPDYTSMVLVDLGFWRPLRWVADTPTINSIGAIGLHGAENVCNVLQSSGAWPFFSPLQDLGSPSSCNLCWGEGRLSPLQRKCNVVSF